MTTIFLFQICDTGIWNRNNHNTSQHICVDIIPEFTHETNKEDIFFLGLKVKLLDGKISTDLFVKSTDRHQSLHYTSLHPEYTKSSIVFSQALNVRRIRSYESDFVRHLRNMKSWFSERRYPSSLVESETKKVKFTPNINNRKRGKSIKAVTFVLTYHPKLKSLRIRSSIKICTFYLWAKKQLSSES